MSPLRPNPVSEIKHVIFEHTTYHFSSVRYKTLLCPYRNKFEECKCPWLSIERDGKMTCCFAHNEQQLRPKPDGDDTYHHYTNAKGEYDDAAWKRSQSLLNRK